MQNSQLREYYAPETPKNYYYHANGPRPVRAVRVNITPRSQEAR